MSKLKKCFSDLKNHRISFKKFLAEIAHIFARIFQYFFEFFMMIILYFPSKIIYKKRDIFIISERGTDARDNGMHLFRYIRTEHPEIDAYYIITRNSSDRKNVEPYGNVINHRSLKHYIYFFASKVKISTHVMGYSPDIEFYNKINRKHHLDGKLVFLQHGVILNDLPNLHYKRTGLDLFVCGAKPEYDFISSAYGYPENNVVCTGLARFDNLCDFETKKQILVMPTWRSFLRRTPENEFSKTDYAIRWNSLLNNSELVSLAEQNGYKIVFYPHYEMQPYVKNFSSQSKAVKIADKEHFDVQQLLKESDLLITDYSSVFFDFSYMRKPVVYYQFDKERFFSEHYSHGYFDYEKDGFGTVVTDEKNLIEIIKKYFKNSFKIEEEFEKKIDEFFLEKNDKNCERIFNEIMKVYRQ